ARAALAEISILVVMRRPQRDLVARLARASRDVQLRGEIVNEQDLADCPDRDLAHDDLWTAVRLVREPAMLRSHFVRYERRNRLLRHRSLAGNSAGQPLVLPA